LASRLRRRNQSGESEAQLRIGDAAAAPIRRGSAASGEASLLADARCRLNPLVVRRFAPNDQRMISAAIVAGAKRPGNNK